MSQSIWASRPADIYGRRQRDRLYTAVCGLVAVLNGFSLASRWKPSRVVPVGRTHTAVITKREQLSPDVVALTFADPDGGLLPSWTPGSHVDVQLPSGRRRQYSLCGPPGRRTDYRIAVRRIADGGGGSIEMHEAFAVGDPLVFEGPRNAFYLGGDERDVLFVIGGIGVTPILSMMRAAQQRGMDWRAVYAGRSREYMPLLDEVLSLDADRVTVWADDERGRIASADDLLAAASPTTAVYVCGPTGMLDAVRIARDEHANAPLHYERFSPPPVVDGVPFELELARSGRVLDIPANRSAYPRQPLGARRHARPRPDGPAFLPSGLLRHLQGHRARRPGRPSRPDRRVGRRDAGVRLPGDRRASGDRRLGRRCQV